MFNIILANAVIINKFLFFGLSFFFGFYYLLSSPNNFGEFAVATVYATLFHGVVRGSMLSGLTKLSVGGEKSQIESTCLFFLIISSLIICVVGVILSLAFSNYKFELICSIGLASNSYSFLNHLSRLKDNDRLMLLGPVVRWVPLIFVINFNDSLTTIFYAELIIFLFQLIAILYFSLKAPVTSLGAIRKVSAVYFKTFLFSTLKPYVGQRDQLLAVTVFDPSVFAILTMARRPLVGISMLGAAFSQRVVKDVASSCNDNKQLSLKAYDRRLFWLLLSAIPIALLTSVVFFFWLAGTNYLKAGLAFVMVTWTSQMFGALFFVLNQFLIQLGAYQKLIYVYGAQGLLTALILNAPISNEANYQILAAGLIVANVFHILFIKRKIIRYLPRILQVSSSVAVALAFATAAFVVI